MPAKALTIGRPEHGKGAKPHYGSNRPDVGRGRVQRFGGVTAVDGVSIDVPKGRILSIIGPNGAGKTSLLNMISGFYKPDTGRITFEGRDITSKRPSAVAASRARSRTSLCSAA
jgi:ABC-type glutathione transport system ATPase component